MPVCEQTDADYCTGSSTRFDGGRQSRSGAPDKRDHAAFVCSAAGEVDTPALSLSGSPPEPYSFRRTKQSSINPPRTHLGGTIMMRIPKFSTCARSACCAAAVRKHITH